MTDSPMSICKDRSEMVCNAILETAALCAAATLDSRNEQRIKERGGLLLALFPPI